MRVIPLVTALALTAAASAAQADIWRLVDANGQVQYTDRWEPGAQLIKTEHPSSPSSSSSAPSSPAPSSAPSTERASQQIADQNTQERVQQDVDAVKSEQCAKAKEYYEKSIQARRIYKQGPNGERQYLSEDEMNQQRVQARQAVEATCGTGAK